jgi:NCS2 family nucleobase:cation symporter-2
MQIFQVGRIIGSGLPVIMGVSFAYLPSLQALTSTYGLGAVFGAQIIGGLVAIVVGLNIKRLLVFFPPLITGTVVFTIGLSLYPTAINYMAGGVGSEDYGSIKNWIVALITLAVVTIFNHFGKGILKLSSILLGIVVGYTLAAFLGMVNFDSVMHAGVIQVPMPLHFGVEFEWSSIITLGILFIINSVQSIGDFTATTMGAMDRMPSENELRGGIVSYGLMNMVAAVFGGLPTATYSQNVGIVATTKVINRIVFAIASVIILLAGIVPKFSALLTTIPYCVLGGATISVFASIAMTGMNLIAKEKLTFRNSSIVGLSVAIGMGVTQVPAALALLPDWVTTIFGKSPVVLATIFAIGLNIFLPGKTVMPAGDGKSKKQDENANMIKSS